MKSKTITYACGRIRRRIDSGAWEAYIIGSSTRRSFRALDDAKAWLDAQEGGNPVTLTAAQMADAARALALLPAGATLEAAASAYAARSIATRAVDLEAEASEYLADCARRLRPPTVAQYRRHLGMALRSPLLGIHLGAHTKAAIRAYIAEQVSSYEGAAALRALSAFYSHLLEREIITASPADGVRAPKTARKPPSVLTIEQAQALIEHARIFRGGDLLPYISIALFAGIRPAEVERLAPGNIGDEYITVEALNSKTARARTVPIHPNLRAILDSAGVRGDKSILPASIPRTRKLLTAFILGLPFEWHQDILRHTYASYRYDESRDAAATAAELGHTSTVMLFSHYRGLVPPGSGQKFFTIT